MNDFLWQRPQMYGNTDCQKRSIEPMTFITRTLEEEWLAQKPVNSS